jgi:sugar phosphate isomerase/epimerase
MRHLSLGYLTVMDVTPAECVAVAADTGYQGISLAAGKSFLPPRMDLGLPLISVIEDDAMRRETLQRARDTGITLDQMEGFILWPEMDLDRCRRAMDLTAEMGIPQVASFDADADQARSSDHLAALCDMAAERRLSIVIEPHSRSALPSVTAGAKRIAGGKFKNLKLLVDALHLTRGKETPDDVAKVREFIDCGQWCDGPLVSESGKAYAHEGMFERQVPGEGEFPLTDLMKVMPKEGVIYMEVPQRAAREAGVSARERARRAIDGIRNVIAATS